MPRLLQQLWGATGKVYMAVCSGGAALVTPHSGGARFEQLLDEVPAGIELIFAVICGNDLMQSSWRIGAYEAAWERAAAAFKRAGLPAPAGA